MESTLKEFQELVLPFKSSLEKFQGAGGNISVKDNNIMIIKASGYKLDEVTENNGYSILIFNPIKNAVLHADLEEENTKKIKDLTEENLLLEYSSLRPSMETAFHVFLKKYVFHCHSCYSNIINCSKEAEVLFTEIFSDSPYSSILIPYITPGIKLGIGIKSLAKANNEEKFDFPDIIFLKNHGIIFHASEYSKILEMISWLDNKLVSYFKLEEGFPSLKYKEMTTNHYTIARSSVARSEQEDVELYTKILFPDQSIFINDLYLFDSTLPPTKRKVYIEDNRITICAPEREAICIMENIHAYDWLLNQMDRLNLTPDYLSSRQVLALHDLESEKYRKGLEM
jgi:ribulose-5-phosphate 4-epimerase/fuculose-1-phosphate aldolase